jgi:hypothetical protein
VEPRVLDWYRKRRPQGYQTLMNSVLENYVDEETKKEAWIAGRAQELFRRFHAQCFWHYDPDLEISTHNFQLVIDGLRKFGGREGFMLAEELCR